MASPVAAGKVGGARKVRKNKGRNNKKGVKGEEGSRFWMKLRFLSSCMSFRSKAESSKRGKNKQDDAIQPVARASSSNSNSRTSRSPPPNNEINYYSHLKQFTFHELRLATRNFRPEYFLGEGGFGTVFKGWISHNGSSPSRPGMGLPVAVKTLNREGNQGHKEWVAEVNHLGALQHPNLVKLVGYCIEDEQRLLVYEFMPRGSLENHLFKRAALPLSWNVRMKIMLGAAKGLAFLHEEAKKPLIYRDFKTSNILLDLDYNAKLCDFGLAKDAPVGDLTHVSTRVMGTQGYAAPEYVLTGHLTSKSDVYSFGVVFLEMLTGRRAMEKRRPQKEQNLVEWARPFMRHNGGFYQLLDPRLEGQYSPRGAYKAMRLVAHCICRDQKVRPLMSEVVNVLKSISEYNDIPSSPSPPSPFQSWQVGSSSSSSRSHGVNKYGLKVGSSTASSSRSTPSRFQASPLSFTPPFLSPKPSGGSRRP